jgi:acetyltransferase-like isoleucine patch superfamily enzyme
MEKGIIKKIFKNPATALSVGLATIKGQIFKALCKIKKSRVSIGTNFRIYHWPKINGPGKVVIGNRVDIDKGFLRRTCIITHTKNSIVMIGDDCTLAGTRISCSNHVKIGVEGLIGVTTIIDSDVIPNRYTVLDKEWLTKFTGPILIGSFFWGGVNSYILKGAIIGDESVLSAGAVALGKEYPEKSLIVGNPGRRIGSTR